MLTVINCGVLIIDKRGQSMIKFVLSSFDRPFMTEQHISKMICYEQSADRVLTNIMF